MTTYIKKVRKALELYASDATWGKDDWGVLAINVREYGMPGREAHAALSALQAHEAEVKGLVGALETSIATMQAYSFHLHGEHEHGPIGEDIAKARTALAKVKS